MGEPQVHISVERERKCGYRKPDATGVGIYFMGGGGEEACERLPFPLHTCPTCGAGFKYSRSFTWIGPQTLFAAGIEPVCDQNIEHQHEKCPCCNPAIVGEKAGLVWVGNAYYSPREFLVEAREMGISRKLPSIPRGFEVGRDIIYFAHLLACPGQKLEGFEPEPTAGVFHAFRPTYVDLVIEDENDIPQRAMNLLDRLGDRGRLVKVVKEK